MTDRYPASAPGITPPPARCPRCGAAVAGTLLADPATPWYACGSTPNKIRCVEPYPNVIENVEPVMQSELFDLRGLFLAIAPTLNAPRLSVCNDAGCDGVAINGVCDREDPLL